MSPFWYEPAAIVHILSVIVWVGGYLFMAIVLGPLNRKLDLRTKVPDFFNTVGQRFRTVGWICIVLILLSGWAVAAARAGGIENLLNLAFWTQGFGMALMHKLAVVVLVLILAVIHDFIVGPRWHAAMAEDPDSPRAIRLRSSALWIARINLLLIIVVVVAAIMLIR